MSELSPELGSKQGVSIIAHPVRPNAYLLQTEQWLPCQIAELFDFFSDAGNLEFLTPPWLRFRILTPLPLQMHAGALIDYRLRLHGVPIRWRTEISAWNPPHVFVDEQRQGPYRSWIHEHQFLERDGGTLVSDTVTYAAPGGRVVHDIFVKPDLLKIFAFRREKLAAKFAATTM